MTDQAAAKREAGRRLVLASGAVLILWLLSSYALFFNPPLGEPEQADAVVVLGGASSERLPVGLELVSDGWAPVLVLSHTDTPGNVDADQRCHRRQVESLICFRPDPMTTRGEARAIARLAADKGWDTILVVTSRYHAVRSYQYIDQCSSARIIMAGSDPELGELGWIPRFVEESAGLLAGAVRPVCANQI
ncbi:YdcF family protein [uncultured Arthrobacter sp.]|uniref:YdcF family protein n=1 Tax=uncultured Arthrobacter sp. TaxID=114050 RepID=UPI002601C00A|nr:YdcF family protein [uncultured Arthrobacter sp.]